jgi:signal transduction histidine kinase
MSLVNAYSLRQLLGTSNFRQASTIAFVCLLISLISIICSNHLLEVVTRSHVREMILNDVRAQQLHGSLRSTTQVVTALQQREPTEARKEHLPTVVDAQGRLRYGNAWLVPQFDCTSGCLGNWRHAVVPAANGPAEILGLLVPLADGGSYFSAYNLRPMLERTRIIPLMTGATMLLVLLLILLTSLPFSRRNLERINHIRDTLARYASGDHGSRVACHSDGDEFDQLGSEVNHSLQRIDRLMEEVKNITSHIAHELRTPLTRLQARLLDVAEQLQDEPARAELMQAVSDSERIQSLFRAVMRIGEVETGRCAHQFESHAAHALLQDIAEYYQPLAEERDCQLVVQCSAQCRVYGDRALLFQALANLVDNALKYAPRGSPVTLRGEHVRNRSRLSVADRGRGIPNALNDRAMARFQRLDTSGDIPGNGLGLTLTRAICDLHGGQLLLIDNQPGLCATLEIKAPAD